MHNANRVACKTPSLFPSATRCTITTLFTRPDMGKIRQNMTAEQLAECFGVSPSLANGWMNGTRKPIGPARKLLLLVEKNPNLAEQLKSL